MVALRRRVRPHARRDLMDESLQLIARRLRQANDEGVDARVQIELDGGVAINLLFCLIE